MNIGEISFQVSDKCGVKGITLKYIGAFYSSYEKFFFVCFFFLTKIRMDFVVVEIKLMSNSK